MPREPIPSPYPVFSTLVAFPIVLFAATLGALLAFIGTADAFYYRAAMVTNVAGVLTALIAAIPGALRLRTLPAGSPARTAASRHTRYALLAIGLFAVSAALLWRGWTGRLMVAGHWDLDATIPLAVGVVGMVAAVIVGALGWAQGQLAMLHHRPYLFAARPTR
jgi:uncharacterized membrane protein